MFNIKEMLGSKKFKVTLFSLLALVCSVLAEKLSITEAFNAGLPIVLAYLGAQGLADFGKAKAQAEKETNEGKGEPTGS